MGKGFYSTAIGISFNKIISYYDYNFLAEYHYSFKRQFNEVKVTPQGGASTLISAGITPNLGPIRLGASLMYSNEFSSQVEGKINSKSNNRYFYELGFTINYSITEYSISLNYADQTFLGVASNTTLSKTIGLSLVKFFPL
jgi:hypothetical protein